MNKWQKVACQISRDEVRGYKELGYSYQFKDARNYYMRHYRIMKYTFEDFIDFKNWHKKFQSKYPID